MKPGIYDDLAEMRERLATISYGWETPEFYRKWPGEDDPESNRSLARAELAPLSPLSAYSKLLFDLFNQCMTEDPSLRERFARHYRQFRAAVRGPVRRPPGGGRANHR